jgi:uncharacterized protein YraI
MSRRLNYRIVVFAALILGVLVLALSGTVRAQSGVTGTALVGLNVRAGPGKAFDRVGVLLRGQTVELNGRARGWFRFSLPNSDRQGWVLGNLLRITGDSRTLPEVNEVEFVVVATPPPPRTGDYPGTTDVIVPAPPGAVVVTALTDVNIRGCPSMGCERLGVLKGGQSIVVDGRSGAWFRFSYPNSDVKGWVIARLVKVTGDIRTLPNVTFP